MTISLNRSELEYIGRIVVSCSQIETFLGALILIDTVGQNTKPEKEKHEKLFQEVMRKSFRARATKFFEIAEHQITDQETLNYIKVELEKIISWRDVICHGGFSKLNENEINVQFWDRASFDNNSGPRSKTIHPQELQQIYLGILEFIKTLFETFKIDEKINFWREFYK